MISGIYKIENKINHNVYIGMSHDIKKRWKRHKANANNPESREYNKALYRAFRKYGVANFSFTIVELVDDLTLLPEREKFWISYYNSYKNGYNETIGGEGVKGVSGERHANHSLDRSDVIDIRIRWSKRKESVQQIYIDYKDKISKTGFKKIYSWQTWKDVLPELNTEENRTWHRLNGKAYSNPGEKNGRSKLSDEDVKIIRERFHNGETVQVIYQDYKYTNITYGSFANAVYGYNRKEI